MPKEFNIIVKGVILRAGPFKNAHEAELAATATKDKNPDQNWEVEEREVPPKA